MSYNYSKLLGRIIEVFGTQKKFAEAMGFSERTLSNKLTGKTPWDQCDIEKACILLKIPKTQINVYFFKLKVQ